MRSARRLMLAAFALWSVRPVVSLAAQEKDPDKTIAGGGTFPAGWHVRTERNAPASNLKFVAIGDGNHATGKATNELSILVQGGKVSFLVNGKEVYSAKATDVDAQGIVGYRVNHNLDVHLGPLGIHRM